MFVKKHSRLRGRTCKPRRLTTAQTRAVSISKQFKTVKQKGVSGDLILD